MHIGIDRKHAHLVRITIGGRTVTVTPDAALEAATQLTLVVNEIKRRELPDHSEECYNAVGLPRDTCVDGCPASER